MLQGKWLKDLYTAFYADDSLFFLDEASGDVTFYCNEMVTFSVNLKNVNLASNLDKGDPDTNYSYQTFVLT